MRMKQSTSRWPRYPKLFFPLKAIWFYERKGQTRRPRIHMRAFVLTSKCFMEIWKCPMHVYVNLPFLVEFIHLQMGRSSLHDGWKKLSPTLADTNKIRWYLQDLAQDFANFMLIKGRTLFLCLLTRTLVCLRTIEWWSLWYLYQRSLAFSSRVTTSVTIDSYWTLRAFYGMWKLVVSSALISDDLFQNKCNRLCRRTMRAGLQWRSAMYPQMLPPWLSVKPKRR